MGSGKYWQRNGHFSEEKNYQKFHKNGQKSIFSGSNPHFFTFHLILLQKLTLFIFCTLLSNKKSGNNQNVPLPKIGPNRRILTKNLIFCFGNTIFVKRHLLPCVWRPFYLLDQSQYLFLLPSYGHLSVGDPFFWEIFTQPHYGTLSVVNSPCTSRASCAGWITIIWIWKEFVGHLKAWNNKLWPDISINAKHHKDIYWNARP